MSETEWGQLRPCESYGRVGDVREDCVVVPYSQALSDTYKDHKHACHTMMLARDPAVLWNLYPTRAAVLVSILTNFRTIFTAIYRYISTSYRPPRPSLHSHPSHARSDYGWVWCCSLCLMLVRPYRLVFPVLVSPLVRMTA